MKIDGLTPERLTDLIDIHLRQSREISKRMLKAGKDETSSIVKHKVIITNGLPEFQTTITFLPVRRLYKEGIGEVLIGDELVAHELELDGME